MHTRTLLHQLAKRRMLPKMHLTWPWRPPSKWVAIFC